MNKCIDFIIVSYNSFELASLLIRSIVKYTKPYDFNIYLVDNSDQRELFNDSMIDNFTYLKGNNDVPKGDFPSELSAAHSHGLQRGLVECKGDYICLLDVDTCFLDYWTEELLPLLEDNLFLSSRWESDRDIARPQFLVTKSENIDKYNIDCGICYNDSGGIFTKVARENNLKYLILSNSYNDHSLRDHHAIDPGRKIISGGEQAFISNDNELTPFFWHYGRGVIFGTPDEWFELLDKFLNE